MVQESHLKVERVILGNLNATLYSVGGYQFACISYYNSIYIFNKNIDLHAFQIHGRYICMTISSPLILGSKNSKLLTIQSCYVPSRLKDRRDFFQTDGLGLEQLLTSSRSPPCLLMGDFNDCPNPNLDFTHGGPN